MNTTNYPDILYEKLDFLSKNNTNEDIESSKLFDYQKNVFNFMTKTNQRGILLYHSVGSGKCMGLNTPILMYDGSIKKIQDIEIGDLLMGDDSSSREVLTLARGVDSMYNVWYGSAKYTVNSEHILCLKTNKYPYKIYNKDKITVYYLINGRIQTTDFYYSKYKNKDIALEESIKFTNMIESDENNKIIHMSVKEYLKLQDCEKKLYKGFRKRIYFDEYSLSKSPLLIGALSINDHSLLENKYLINSVQNREYLLAGILGALGVIYKYKGNDAYLLNFNIGKNEKIYINKIMFVVNSLNIGHKLSKNKDKYTLVLYGKELLNIHLKSAYSEVQFNPELSKDNSVYDINIKPAGINNYYGFTITGNRRYVLGDCTITHNTMTSVSVAEYFKRMGKQIIVLSSKSLQINYKKEIINFRKSIIKKEEYNNEDLNYTDDYLNYKFITSNSRNMIDKITNSDSKLESKEGIYNRLESALKQINKQSLDNKIIIVDEAHNLFNSIANGSENANTFYDMVMDARNIKIIFMTGTPIINDPFEIAICFNMIMGNMKQSKPASSMVRKSESKKRITLFPEYYTDFFKYFIASGDGGISNEAKFKNRIFGLTSYYGDFYTSGSASSISEDLKKTAIKENYPDRLPVKFEIIEMSNIQSTYYLKARDIEKLENANAYIRGAGISMSNDKNSGNTSYRIKSRQASNIIIDENTFSIAEKEKDISKYSTKIAKIFTNIEKSKEEIGTVLIYSTFLEYGVEAVAKFLDIMGYRQYELKDEKINNLIYKYAIFSGKQSEEEKINILKTFNSDENKDGSIIKILMITKSGTEGLDLKNVRYIHIMEPYWNFSLLQQVIARGVRYKSHVKLEEKYRNVQVYIYLSDYNKEDLSDIKNKLANNKTNASRSCI
jgi:superfamily II DNA or RNA helicase